MAITTLTLFIGTEHHLMADTVLVLRDSLPGWLTNTRFGRVAYILDSWDDVSLELMPENFVEAFRFIDF